MRTSSVSTPVSWSPPTRLRRAQLLLERGVPSAKELAAHSKLLVESYGRMVGRQLFDFAHELGESGEQAEVASKPDSASSEEDWAEALLLAPFALVSHGVQAEPIFNYGNAVALHWFELTWEELCRLPSRRSAEPVAQAERERLLSRVREHGFIRDYRGVRISAKGRRFWIEEATVWNLIDEAGVHRGQAACFANVRAASS